MADWRTDFARHVRGEVTHEAPLATRVSVRVGGAAALLFRPADDADLAKAMLFARDIGQPSSILGGGANTVIGDGGVSGITIKLGQGEGAIVRELGDQTELEISAGAPSARLVQLAREHRLLGVEWAAGIPGTIGGMTAMNAGTRAGEMKDGFTEAFLVGPDGGEWTPAKSLDFKYRHSNLDGRIVTRVRCRFRKGNPDEIAASLAAMDADRSYRKRTQPLNLPNSGSVFRNPPGDFAARLVEAAGLKGTVEGSAAISDRHANFIVNRGGATARDVTTLMARMQQKVLEQFQIPLALEVRLVGQFVPSTEVLGLVIDS